MLKMYSWEEKQTRKNVLYDLLLCSLSPNEIWMRSVVQFMLKIIFITIYVVLNKELFWKKICRNLKFPALKWLTLVYS